MIVQQEIENPKQKRYSCKEKASHILYMLDREEDKEQKRNITAYAAHYKISRQTLYEYQQQFEDDYENKKAGRKKGSRKNKEKKWQDVPKQEKDRVIKTILTMVCSPTSEREIKRTIKVAFDLELSRRKIREIINEYASKAMEILAKMNLAQYVKLLAIDEMFSGRKPILTGVDLCSFAVVICHKAEKRDCLTWKEALNSFVNLELVASDQAKGIVAAVGMMEGVEHQFDLFHLMWDIERLLRQLEAQAYRKIDAEYKAEARWHKNQSNKEKLFEEYNAHQEQALKSIHVFDEVEKAVRTIYQSLEIFDGNGNLIDPGKSLEKIYAAAQRMKQASNNRKIINIAKRIVDPRFLLYLTKLNQTLLSLQLHWKEGIDPVERSSVIATFAKHYFFSNLAEPCVHFQDEESKAQLLRRRSALEHKLAWKHVENLFEVRMLQQSLANFDTVFAAVRHALSRAFRASSLVESFNSQLRGAQQIKKSLNSNFLALSVLRWNVTKFENGKRKGKSPCQLLGIQLPTSDWLDLLLAA